MPTSNENTPRQKRSGDPPIVDVALTPDQLVKARAEMASLNVMAESNTVVRGWVVNLSKKHEENVSNAELTSPTPPAWVRECFTRKQYSLLCLLWGKQDVTAESLCKELGYDNHAAEETLHKLVGRTNDGLTTNKNRIGRQYTISERKRDDVLCYYLHLDD